MTTTPRPIISIITPVWNGGELIEECIKSVQVALDGIPYEHLILEGGSTDDTVEKVKKYLGGNVRLGQTNIKAIFPKWEQGVNVAFGDWIYYLGADDRMEPGNHYGIMEAVKRKEDILYFNLNCLRFMGSSNTYSPLRSITGSVSPLNYFVRRTLLEKIRIENGGQLFNYKYTTAGDLPITMRIFMDKRIKKLKLPGITIATAADNGYTVGKTDKEYDKDFYKIVCRNLKYVRNPIIKGYLWVRLIIKMYKRQFRMDPDIRQKLHYENAL